MRTELKLSDGAVLVFDHESLAGYVMNPLRPREVMVIFKGCQPMHLKLGEIDDAKKLDAIFSATTKCVLHGEHYCPSCT